MNLTEKKIYYTPLNERICVDGDDMWFVSAYGNTLCKGSRVTGECECIAKIPVGEEGYRWSSPSCIRYKDTIILIPYLGTRVWRYDLTRKKFFEVIVENPHHIGLNIFGYWVVDQTLWAWSGLYGGLQRLIELDLENNVIRRYYRMTKEDASSFAWRLDRWENHIYLFDNSRKELYEFDIVSKKTEKYKLHGVTGTIVTICCDEDAVWLAGEEKCIYTWYKVTGKLKRHMDFPMNFWSVKTNELADSKVNWSFYQGANLKEYVCFVTQHVSSVMSNGILFINKKDYTMRMMKLDDEAGNGAGVYKIEYVIDGRYIGIHYWPNGFISEIDTADFTVIEKMLSFSLGSYTKL